MAEIMKLDEQATKELLELKEMLEKQERKSKFGFAELIKKEYMFDI